MLYDYECSHCKIYFEKILPVSECDSPQICPKCDAAATKIIIQGHGGIWRKSDGQPWVRDAAKMLNDNPDDPRPNPNIQTTDDYVNYLKANPHIVPKESHPCLPSSMGDCFDSQPDPAEVAKKRTEAGNKLLRSKRSITINSGQTA